MRVAIASKTAVLLLLPLVPVIVASANRAGLVEQANRGLLDPQSIAEGARLFAINCGNAYCHGTSGSGGGAPRLRGKGLESSYVFKSISNGIPGSSMPSFKSELSEVQIWKLVAFIVDDAKTDAVDKPDARGANEPASQPPRRPAPNSGSATVGDAQAGRVLFFDSAQPKRCGSCHSFEGEGTPIGPDLSKTKGTPARELFLSILFPRDIKDSRYATVTLTLRNGDKVAGVKKEEDTESIRVYDTAALPAVLRTVQKGDVLKTETSRESVMPNDYANSYSLKQLLDLVTFLKSSRSGAPVTLKDLLD
jgi:putative heme-binding domain-containing protein